jgi:DNA-binding response OmpR family regulator
MNVISILLIEDELDVVNFVKKGLGEESFEVSVALNGVDGLEMASKNQYDIILLDIMIPEKNGIEVCKEIRFNTPDNIALGLNLGADDYLVKPFKFNELIARINAILRRLNLEKKGSQVSQAKYFLSNMVFDDDAKKVSRNGKEISLTPTEYRLLFTLLKNKGKVLSRIELLENAWDISFNLGTNVVDVYINYLRKKIDTDFEPKLIHTVVGMGYILKEA